MSKCLSLATAALALATLALSGCATSRVVMSSKWDEHAKPSYVDYLDAYALGLIGNQKVDLRAVCMDQRPYAIQQGTTFLDGAVTVLTLGIYVPTTIKVWCGP